MNIITITSILVTYCIVMFSIIVQGLTIGTLVRRYND